MIEPLFPLVPSIIVAAIAVVVLLFLETKRKQKFLSLRMIAQTLLVASVFLLTLRPSFVSTASSSSFVLLTDGYRQSTVDSLKSLKPVALKSFNELPDLSGISAITGNGLPSWALELLPSNDYSFIPSPSPKGITAIETDEHIYAHRWNEIRGTYSGPESMIKLQGPGGIDDSVKISDGNFSLSFFAKAPGRFNYNIITHNGTETLPLVIEPERSFNIIILSNYPTFEMRYLKNFLASKGHSLSIRNQVSKGLYKFEFANRNNASENFKSITSSLLNTTDLLIMDERSWNTLSSGEQKNIRTAVNDGLGVVIIPESEKLQLIPFKKNQLKDTVRISLRRAGSFRFPVLPLESKSSTSLLTSTDNRVLSGYIFSGKGKIGYQLLSETYQAGLQGKSEVYSALWVPLLEKVARAHSNDLKLRITSPFPCYENEPISFDIISSGKEPKLKIDNIDFPLIEDVFVDDLWHGTTWLDGNQWHDFALDSATTVFHVAKAGTWKSVRATNNRRATALHAGQQTNNEVASISKDNSKIKTLLFMIFILSAGFLWLAPKL